MAVKDCSFNDMDSKQNFFFGALVILGITLLSAAESVACSCAAPPTLDDSLKGASVVLLGRVGPTSANPLRPGQLEVKFRIKIKFVTHSVFTRYTLLPQNSIRT